MSYLVYCILDGDCQEPRQKVRFLGYPRASIMVRAAGLGVAASKTSTADVTPDVARLLVYSKIIEWFNSDCTVIPMRYGCTFRGLDEIARFLEEHKDHYLRLLAELRGRVEMSALVTMEEPRPPVTSRTGGILRLRSRFVGAGTGSGTAYLAQRREHYALEEASRKRREEIRSGLCAMAEGTFIRCSDEYSAQGEKGMLAVHFLVLRERIGKFTDALRPLSAGTKSSLVVTGPWPPYNFVCSPKLPN